MKPCFSPIACARSTAFVGSLGVFRGDPVQRTGLVAIFENLSENAAGCAQASDRLAKAYDLVRQ
jgi:hypothetical protein